MEVRRFFLGCDLAKTLDFTSFSIIEMDGPEEAPRYHLIGLDRIKGVSYPAIVYQIISTIKRLEEEEGTADGPHLAFDASGLGAPIKDYLMQEGTFSSPREIYPTVFVGGEAARRDPATGNYNIAKTIIFSNLLSLMQHKRFDYASDLQALPLLEEEIANFKYHLTPAGHATMDAVAGKHDDLLCSIAIPLIIAEWRYKTEAVCGLVLAIPKRRHPIFNDSFDYR